MKTTRRLSGTQKRLAEIAAAMAAGADAEEFRDELDRLLDTELAARDTAAETAWEQNYRRKGTEEPT